MTKKSAFFFLLLLIPLCLATNKQNKKEREREKEREKQPTTIETRKRENEERRPIPPFFEPTPTPTPKMMGNECQIFELDQTECFSVLENRSVFVPLGLTQQDLFNLIAVRIANVRMAPDSCRFPFISVLCQFVFQACEPPFAPCEDCILAEEGCGVSLNCSDIFGNFSGPECIPPFTGRNIPVWSCLNETAEDILCCPDPFFHSPKSGECEAPSCPLYVYGETKQNRLVLAYFIVSWISIICGIVGLLPNIKEKKLKLPEGLAQWLLITFLVFLLFSNWGIYVGAWDFVCEFDSLFDFYYSSYCLTQCFFIIISLFMAVWMFFWYAVRVFLHTYQHSTIWVRYHLPTNSPPGLVIIAISLITSLAFAFAFIFYIRDNKDELLMALNGNFQCIPTMRDEGLYLCWLPLLIICTPACFLVFAILGRLALIRVSIPIRFVLVLFLFAFVMETSIIHVIYYNRYEYEVRNNLGNWGTCVATKPEQSDYVDTLCEFETLPGFSMLAYVQMSLALFPLLYSIILNFTRKGYWEEMSTLHSTKSGKSHSLSMKQDDFGTVNLPQ